MGQSARLVLLRYGWAFRIGVFGLPDGLPVGLVVCCWMASSLGSFLFPVFGGDEVEAVGDVAERFESDEFALAGE